MYDTCVQCYVLVVLYPTPCIHHVHANGVFVLVGKGVNDRHRGVRGKGLDVGVREDAGEDDTWVVDSMKVHAPV